MLWLAILVLVVLALAPMLCDQRRASRTGPSPSGVAFYRGQLAELDRERDGGLISPAEHRAARLEVARRLLSADAEAPRVSFASSRRWPAWAAAAMVPLAAFLLYLRVGSPGLPAAPFAPRIAHDRAVIASLTQRLAEVSRDPQELWQTEVVIGSAEADMGQRAEAAAAWRRALAIHFDPTLAAQTAEAETEAAGEVTRQAAALFRAALAAAPANAPWRAAAAARLGEGAEPDR